MVWTYWEGPCPDFIELCLESMRRRCNVTVLNRATFDAMWTPDRDLPDQRHGRPIEQEFAAGGVQARS